MKILIDTDVLLDVALARPPHVKDSATVLKWAEAGNEATIAWHSISNCAYLLKADARPFLEMLLSFVQVAGADTAIAQRALDLPMKDLEDAMQSAAAQACAAKYIITRNLPDYKLSPVPALNPRQFIDVLNYRAT